LAPRRRHNPIRRKKVNMKTLEKWNPVRVSPSWDPFRELEEMQSRLASLFGRRLPFPGSREEPFGLTEWTPPVDIAEDDKEYTIQAELPGVNKEDVKVTVEGGFSITGERKSEKEEKDKKYHRIERSYGSFIRSFTLPEGTSTDKIGAEFKDGILRLHLPKDEKAKPKTVDVKLLSTHVRNYGDVFHQAAGASRLISILARRALRSRRVKVQLKGDAERS
jgi:HSP20 family protein